MPQSLHLPKTTLAAKRSLQWFLIDADKQILGRLASQVVSILRGKHRLDYMPHQECGDGVIIINAAHISVTGAKASRKTYRSYGRNVGSQRFTPYKVMLERHPTRILEHAIRGMMPRNKLTRLQLTRLRLFPHSEHTLTAQQPISL